MAVAIGVAAILAITVVGFAVASWGSATRSVTYKVRAPLPTGDGSAKVSVSYRDAGGVLQNGRVRAPHSSTFRARAGSACT